MKNLELQRKNDTILTQKSMIEELNERITQLKDEILKQNNQMEAQEKNHSKEIIDLNEKYRLRMEVQLKRILNHIIQGGGTASSVSSVESSDQET